MPFDPFQVKEMVKAIDDAQTAVEGLRSWLWQYVVAHDVVPVRLPAGVSDLLGQFAGALESLRSQVSHLSDAILAEPAGKFSNGTALTRQEYHFLCALGVIEQETTKALGLCNLDDYEAFSFLHYEDEKQRCYINPEERPREPGKAKLRICRPPEELRLDALRPGQREFFKRYLPSLYERFS